MEEINTNVLEQTESIELNLTAKGLYQWTIKVRDPMLDITTIERLTKIEQAMKALYPNNVMSAGVGK